MRTNKRMLYIALSLYILLVSVISLFRDGMFMDAVQYTAVAHNMRVGYGSFWQPEFSMRGVSGYNAFYEQPPLGLFLLNIFYRVLGDSMYVERIFILLCMIITLMLMRAIWKIVYKEIPEFKQHDLLPIFLYFCIPIIMWTYDSFMLENIMVIWILLSVYFQLKQVEKNNSVYILLGGACIFLATFTKGIPGLFPLGIPFI